MHQLYEGDFNKTMLFELEEQDSSLTVVNDEYVIVENGYLQWPSTMPPLEIDNSKSAPVVLVPTVLSTAADDGNAEETNKPWKRLRPYRN